MRALESGAVETLIVYENLETLRVVLKSAAGTDETIYINPNQQGDPKFFKDESGMDEEVVDTKPLVE